MREFYLILLMLSIALFWIGLIKPELVLRWIPETHRNRQKVLSFFGPLILVTFILFGITIESP
ncbi:hypothetical protein [Planococcus donghaensis]|uniref:hypothetical protein n=1 Tax=Planococcus donghaensis TaxID=414778 RepID=UPI0012EBFFE1|nr:hypothetical protein [Planococcus donghaensis]